MKQEKQTCTKDSLVSINVSLLLIANEKEELQILVFLFGAPFWCSFPLHVKIMDILHNDDLLKSMTW
jgi:hypothetical protein